MEHGVERGTYCVLMFAFGALVGRVRVYGRHWGGGGGGGGLIWNSCSLGLDPGGVNMYSG